MSRINKNRRRWTEEEDLAVIKHVTLQQQSGEEIDFKEVASHVVGRTAKQCRERYENSLRPNVRRGDWESSEVLELVHLIKEHGQNWSVIRERFKSRTYNGIKKKGRKILGEILDRACVSKGFKGKSVNIWTDTEVKKLHSLHKTHKLQLDVIALTMKTGRAEAELDRKLIQTCDCFPCKDRRKSLNSMGGCFKDAWSKAKAVEIEKRLMKELGVENKVREWSIIQADQADRRPAQPNSKTTSSNVATASKNQSTKKRPIPAPALTARDKVDESLRKVKYPRKSIPNYQLKPENASCWHMESGQMRKSVHPPPNSRKISGHHHGAYHENNCFINNDYNCLIDAEHVSSYEVADDYHHDMVDQIGQESLDDFIEMLSEFTAQQMNLPVA